MTGPRARATTLATLLLALAGPPLLVLFSRRIPGEHRSVGAQLALHLVYCSLVAAVLLVVIRCERSPLSSIGLRPPSWSTVATVLLIWAATHFVLPLVSTPLLGALGRGGLEPGLRTLGKRPTSFRLFLALTSGAVEETLYRGYATERLATITGRPWLGGGIAAVAFGLAHIPAWGIGFALGADLPFGILMTFFYLWRRDLLANCIAHSAGLVVSMLAVPPA